MNSYCVHSECLGGQKKISFPNLVPLPVVCYHGNHGNYSECKQDMAAYKVCPSGSALEKLSQYYLSQTVEKSMAGTEK